MDNINLNRENGQKLWAADWNKLISTINLIIDAVNNQNNLPGITKLSLLVNDSGFITSQDVTGKVNRNELAQVATSGSYNDLKDKPSQTTGPQGPEGKSAYLIAVANGFVGTQQLWLNSLKGADGQPGLNGQNGLDGIPGQDGVDGKSVYELAVELGYDGTLELWLLSLHGQNGLNGQDGSPGQNGLNGITPHIDSSTKHWFIGEIDTNILAEGQNGTNGNDGHSPVIASSKNNGVTTITSDGITIATINDGQNGQNGLDGSNGTDGKSAYLLAVDNGYQGTVQQWLDSLHGLDGSNGLDGQNGLNGITPSIDPTTKHWIIGSTDTGVVAEGLDGTNGINGTDGTNGTDGITPHIDPVTKHWMIGSTDTGIIAEGKDGAASAAGDDGKSAYELYLDTVELGETPLSLSDWLDSLKGQDGTNGTNGTNGKSAYQSYVDTTSDNPVLTEELWILSLHGQNGSNGTNGTNGKSAYLSYLDTTSDDPVLTEQQWVASLHGANGTNGLNGTNGQDGVTPTIDPITKHWILGSTDTGVVAEGQNGTNGTNGTNGITPHIDSTTGNWFIGSTNTGVHALGPSGNDGTNGTNGTNGTDGITPIVSVTNITGGHNVAFSYGTGDSRNTDFNVIDGISLSNESALSGGNTLSAVTTGEKYNWNNKASIWSGTQAQYDALSPNYDSNTIYIITAAS